MKQQLYDCDIISPGSQLERWLAAVVDTVRAETCRHLPVSHAYLTRLTQIILHNQHNVPKTGKHKPIVSYKRRNWYGGRLTCWQKALYKPTRTHNTHGRRFFYRATPTRMHSADDAVARCLSVRLSDRLSHADILSKRLNISLKCLNRRVARPF